LDKLIKERSFGEESHKRALNEFKKQIESLKNVIDDKESEINSLLNEISKLNGKIKSLEDLCANTQTLQESTHNDSLTLETNLLKLSQENDKFKSLNKQLQDQLNKLRK
jgi:chromosome segregation ATPase